MVVGQLFVHVGFVKNAVYLPAPLKGGAGLAAQKRHWHGHAASAVVRVDP